MASKECRAEGVVDRGQLPSTIFEVSYMISVGKYNISLTILFDLFECNVDRADRLFENGRAG